MNIQEIRAKFAEAKEQLESNQDRAVPGETEVYNDPPEKTESVDPAEGTPAVKTEASDVQMGVLRRNFDTLVSSSKADQSLIGLHFTGASKAEKSAPILKGASCERPTLMERARRLGLD